jgi:hypothetical protein
MRNYLGVGISIGVLAGVWTQVSVELSLVTWVAFVAWACFYAAGGGREGYTKGLAANLSGVGWGYLVSLLVKQVTFNGALAIAVAVIAFAMCVQASVPLLSFIPGAFAGAASFFGTGFDLTGTVLALVIGASLGWLSAVLAARIQSVVDRSASVAPAAPVAVVPDAAPTAP